MDFPYSVQVNIKDFFSIGKFDFLLIGKSKEWIYHNFPNPDYFEGYDLLLKEDAWHYGEMVLLFHKNHLNCIYSEPTSEFSGGKNLEIDPWFIGKKFKMIEVFSELNRAFIDFSKVTRDYSNNKEIDIHLTKSNVKLLFVKEDEKEMTPDGFRLAAFSLS